MTPLAKAELARLNALPDSDAKGYAIEDLNATPDPKYRAEFKGETFYGASRTEALLKVEGFARDADAQAMLASESCEVVELVEVGQ